MTAVLLISCPDQKGITAAVTNFVYQHDGNILHADQHIDEQSNTFFMRIEWALDGFALPRDQIREAFAPTAGRFAMRWELSFSDLRPRMAVYVSRNLHGLQDVLLWYKPRQFAGEITPGSCKHLN